MTGAAAMFPVRIGRHVLRWAASPRDLARALELRGRVFRPHGRAEADRDRHDDRCRHLLIESASDGTLLGCVRLMTLSPADAGGAAYCAQFYDLGPLSVLPGPMLEIGRLCTDPARADPEVLRLAWASIAALVLAEDIRFLFGATTFSGTDPAPYRACFAHLRGRLAPEAWRPLQRAPRVYPFARALAGEPAQREPALQGMPPLLRGYLGLGCRVSDHAVIDDDLGTLHVFTGLERAAIPQARFRLLRETARAVVRA